MIINNIIRYSKNVFGILKILLYKFLYFKNLKLNGLTRLKVNTKLVITDNGIVYLGDAYFYDNCHLSSIGGILAIGSKVSFNRNNIIVCRDSIEIADNCMFGPNVMIYDHDHKFNKFEIKSNEYNLGTIVIEKNCWIGAGCIILKNTHIGEGSVIGAGCIVKGNIPPHSLVTSNRELNIVPINKD